MSFCEKVPYLPSFEALHGVLLYPSEWLSDSLHQVHSRQNAQTRREPGCDGETLILEIEGNPIAKARARTVRRGSFIVTYDPQEKEKKAFREKLKLKLDQVAKIEMEASNCQLDTRYYVDLTFHMEISKSCSKGQRMAKFWKLEGHKSKPDLDNLEKFVLDCANGILFPDDSQIVQLSSEKFYSETPKTVIKMTTFKETHLHKSARMIITLFKPEELFCMIEEMRRLVEVADAARSAHDERKLKAFFELAAHGICKTMRTYGKQLLKSTKHKFELQEDQIRERKGILYGTSDVR